VAFLLLVWVAAPVWAGQRAHAPGLKLEVFAAAEAEAEFDLRDEHNRSLTNPSLQEELWQAQLAAVFQALMGPTLPRQALLLSLLESFKASLKRPWAIFRVLGTFEALAPSSRKALANFAAGVISSLAPALTLSVPGLRQAALDLTAHIPRVLRC